MTDREREIRDRLTRVTEGPWFTWLSADLGKWTIQVARGWLFTASDKATQADAEFIAHAREDIPWLLSEIDRLRGEK